MTRAEFRSMVDWIITRTFQRGDGAIRRRVGQHLLQMKRKMKLTNRELAELRKAVFIELGMEDNRRG